MKPIIVKFKKYSTILLIVSAYYFICTSGTMLLANKDSKAKDYPSNDYNLPTEWSKFKIVDSLHTSARDKILIITNRPFDAQAPDSVYFPNALSKFRKVTYLLASFNGREWNICKVKNLTEGMNAINKDNNFLLFVHGHGKGFIAALNRTFRIKKRYNNSMILFDWPSKNRNFNLSLARVRRCGENFYNLSLGLKEYREQNFNPNQKLSIMCHTLGNYFISHLVVNGNNQYLKEPIYDNLIINAPAIRAKKHGEVIDQLNLANNIYIMSNYNDRVLRGAYLLTVGKMLGNDIMEPLAKNAVYFDFTPSAGKEHTYFAGYHKFEYTNPTYFSLYEKLFSGLKPKTDTLKQGCSSNVFLIR